MVRCTRVRLRAAVGGWVRYLMLMVKGEGDDDGDSPLSRQENGALSILVVIHLIYYFHSYNKRRLLDNGRQADIQQSFLIFSKIIPFRLSFVKDKVNSKGACDRCTTKKCSVCFDFDHEPSQ